MYEWNEKEEEVGRGLKEFEMKIQWEWNSSEENLRAMCVCVYEFM